MYDVTGVYGVGGSPPVRRELHWRGDGMTVDYPPLTLVELAIAGRIYKLWNPSFDDGLALNAVVKLPGLAAEALLVAVILTYGRRRFGDKAATWAALGFWLNPAVVLDGTVLGYLDAQMAVPASLSVGAALCGWPALASACLAVAILTKAQAVFVAPVVAAILIWGQGTDRTRALARAAAAGSLVVAGTLLPYVIRGAWANLVQAVGRLATHDMLSANAANLWWIFTWALRVFDVRHESGVYRALTQQVRILTISRTIDLGYPNPRVVGLALVIAAIGCAVWRLRAAVSVAQGFALAGWAPMPMRSWRRKCTRITCILQCRSLRSRPVWTGAFGRYSGRRQEW